LLRVLVFKKCAKREKRPVYHKREKWTLQFFGAKKEEERDGGSMYTRRTGTKGAGGWKEEHQNKSS